MKAAALAFVVTAALCAAAFAASAGPVPVPAAGGNPAGPTALENRPSQEAGSAQTTLGKRSDSVHFTLLADFDDAEYFRKLEGDLEKSFSLMQKEFWDFIPPQWREAHIEVAAFGTQQAFDAYAQNDAGLPRGEKGYSSPSAPKIVFMRQDVYYRDVMILVHELTHVFDRFCCAHTPIWLDEGLAQFYANYAGQEHGNALLVEGVNFDALATVDAALRSGTFVELGDLLNMGDDAFYDGSSGLHYAESWALVYFLRRAGGGGDERFEQLYGAIARGVDPDLAFGNTYGQSFDIIRRMWLLGLERTYAEASKLRNAPRAIPVGDKFGQEPPATTGTRTYRIEVPRSEAAAEEAKLKKAMRGVGTARDPNASRDK